MSSNDVNTTVEEEDFTIEELIEQERQELKAAETLLGGQNDSTCTYPEGYLPRQPLYSCRTCAAESGHQAGICYACSLNCHDGHDLVELYTKRQFTCDCGNSKFTSKCKLFENKSPVNSRNSYNHNFDGIYCTCRKPYPPVEAENDETKDDEETDDGMHQCMICEDWFHLKCIADAESELEELRRKIDESTELVCKECVRRLPFLRLCEHLSSSSSTDEEPSVSETPSSSSNNPEAKNRDCQLIKHKESFDYSPLPARTLCLALGWRDNLCRCYKCQLLYEANKASFLLNPEDTFAHYDSERKRKMELKGEVAIDDEKGTLASSVYNLVVKETNNRDAALNAFVAVEEMTRHMTDYFSRNGKRVITKEEVENCFEELRAKRSRNNYSAGSPSSEDHSE